MNTTTRRSLAAVTALVAATALAACSGGDDSDTAATTATDSAASRMKAAATPDADPALASLVGPGCAAYAAQVPTGSGSVGGMAVDPVATAASNNPMLKTLTAAVSGKLNKKVNLVDTLNGGEYTVFAPVDAAFAKVPESTIDKLKKDRDQLTKLLTYHVVMGQLSPSEVIGSQKTVQGDNVKVTGTGDTIKVNNANVICGGVKTANATVYLVDAVLTPGK